MKNLKLVILILLVVTVFVIVRSTGKNRFKEDAKNAVEAVANHNFSIAVSELKTTEKDYLIVDLNESGRVQFANSLKVPFDKLLDESTLQTLKEAENKILLVSDEISKAEKAWVILNQLGIINVFVLSTEENTEVLKYEFQPDTATGLESVVE